MAGVELEDVYITGIGVVITDAGVLQNVTYSPTFLTATVQTSSPSAAVHNHDPSTAGILRVVPTTSIDWTGISGGVSGRMLILTNTATASQVITLKHNSGSSSAGNKFATPGGTDYTVGVGESVTLWYDAASSLWRFAASK